MKRRASRVLFAAATPMLPAWPALSDADEAEVLPALEHYLLAQVLSMPRHLLAPYLLALFAFEWLPLLRHGRAFSGLTSPQRAHIVARWSASPIGPMRDLLKLIRSCALFYYLDHPLVVRRMEEASGRRAAEAPAEDGSRA